MTNVTTLTDATGARAAHAELVRLAVECRCLHCLMVTTTRRRIDYAGHLLIVCADCEDSAARLMAACDATEPLLLAAVSSLKEKEHMSITPLYTKAQATAEATRQAQARAGGLDSAAVAVAALCRQLRADLYQHIEASRTGCTRDELHAAVPAGDLVDMLISAMLADGEVELHGACYRLPRGAA